MNTKPIALLIILLFWAVVSFTIVYSPSEPGASSHNGFDSVLSIFLLLTLLVPVYIYLRYGREPEIKYFKTYEYELPTNDPPAIVNAICGSSEERGVADLNGFKATILDLIDRNYLLIEDSGNKLGYPDSIYLKINPNNDYEDLWDFEVEVINILKEYDEEGLICLDMISESLYYVNSAEFFYDSYRNWKKQILKVLLSNDRLKEVFSNKGDNYLKAFGVFGIIVGFGIIFAASKIGFPISSFLAVSSIILGLTGLICIALPDTIGGQWTPYGREYCAQWKSFGKYIKDYSLIKESKVDSIKIWNKYLVYGTALGVAEAVAEGIQFYIPNKKLDSDSLYNINDHDSFNKLSTSLNKLEVGSESETD